MKVILCFVLIFSIVSTNAFYLEEESFSGHDTQRIVHGERPDLNSFLVWISAFKLLGGKKDGYGAFVTKRHILTVASLVQGHSEWDIRYGSEEFNTLNQIQSSFGYVHPLYDDKDGRFDVGIIILRHFQYTVIPISLPETFTYLPRDFEEGTIVGFDTFALEEDRDAARLRTAYLSVIPKGDCEFANSYQFCAANKFYEANVCKTDVGAAFNVHFRGQVIMAGLLTAIPHLCEKGDRSHYIRVQQFVPWIKAVTETDTFLPARTGSR